MRLKSFYIKVQWELENAFRVEITDETEIVYANNKDKDVFLALFGNNDFKYRTNSSNATHALTDMHLLANPKVGNMSKSSKSWRQIFINSEELNWEPGLFLNQDYLLIWL